MLSAAILVYALRPATPVVQAPVPAPQIVQPISDGEIQVRIDAAVTQAVAEVEARQSQKNEQLAADLKSARQQMIWAAQELDIAQRRVSNQRVAALNMSLPPEPAAKEPR